MPPSPGYRRDSVSTAIASGTKKVTNASPHNPSDAHPYTATGGTLLMFTTATIFRRTRSHRPSVRGIWGDVTRSRKTRDHDRHEKHEDTKTRRHEEDRV